MTYKVSHMSERIKPKRKGDKLVIRMSSATKREIAEAAALQECSMSSVVTGAVLSFLRAKKQLQQEQEVSA